MSRKITSLHVYATRPDGVRESLSYDEEEFNDGTITLSEAVEELVSEGYVRLNIDVSFE